VLGFVIRIHAADQRFGQRHRVHANALGQQQGDVGGVIPVFTRLGALDDVLGQFHIGGDFALAAQIK